MSHFFRLTLLCTLFLLPSLLLIAQEDQVAFAPGMFEIDKLRRMEFGVLEKYKEDFEKARLLRNADNSYAVEITYSKRGRTWTEKQMISAEELADIRSKVSAGPTSKEGSPRGEVRSNGRYGLIASATLHSIHQGILMSYVTSRERLIQEPWGSYYTTERSKFGQFFPYLYSAGTFAGSMILTSGKNINPAAANVHFWGSGMGLAHGAAMIALFRGNDAFEDYQADLAVMGLSSIAEGWIQYTIAKRRNLDYATSMAWNTGNVWGGVGGLYTSFLAVGNEADGDFVSRIIGAGVLGGSVGGMFLTDHLQKKYPRAGGDFSAINALGVATTVFGFGLYETVDNARGAGIVGLLTSGSGLALGYAATQNTNFTRLEGALITLGSYVGSLLGTGLIILTEPESSFGASAMIGGGMVAGWLGTYLYFKNDNAKAQKKKVGSNLHFGLNPAGLTIMRADQATQYRALVSNQRMDMVGMRLTF
jgi:hypothetical protein